MCTNHTWTTLCAFKQGDVASEIPKYELDATVWSWSHLALETSMRCVFDYVTDDCKEHGWIKTALLKDHKTDLHVATFNHRHSECQWFNAQ